MIAAVLVRRPFTKRIRRAALAAVCLLPVIAVAASPAQAAYYPSGPQTFVDKSQLSGWQLCFSDLYGESGVSLDSILAQCNGGLLILAGGPTDSQTLTVLAAAPRADVLFDTGQSNTTHSANGSGWYFNSDYSWGFAKQGDPVERDSCDTAETPNSEQRLCWHTDMGNLDNGYRAGATLELNSSTDYTRYIYQRSNSNAFTFALSGKRLVVSVQASGDVTVSDAAAPLSATSAKKKKRRLLLKPSTASGDPPTITVPLSLTKTAKSKLKQKGKVTVKARVTFAPQGGVAATQTVKLKIKGKSKKK
jgi:hypothetical protein